MSKILISPSILSANFACLGDEVEQIDRAGADMIHIDVMDGHFVPNLTFGPPVIKKIRAYSNKPFDVHLMMSHPQDFIDAFIEAGADIITVHAEAGPHIHRNLQHIRQAGIKAGLALNPATPAYMVENLLDMVDLILVMSVNPGFGGQTFISTQIDKIKKLRIMIDTNKPDIILEVDGGVNARTAPAIIEAGANALVAGSAVFTGNPDEYEQNISRLRI